MGRPDQGQGQGRRPRRGRRGGGGASAYRGGGDPLECECPVCTRIKGVIESREHADDTGKSIGLRITEASGRGTEDASGAKSRRLIITAWSSWSGDGRWL